MLIIINQLIDKNIFKYQIRKPILMKEEGKKNQTGCGGKHENLETNLKVSDLECVRLSKIRFTLGASKKLTGILDVLQV